MTPFFLLNKKSLIKERKRYKKGGGVEIEAKPDSDYDTEEALEKVSGDWKMYDKEIDKLKSEAKEGIKKKVDQVKKKFRDWF